MFARLWWKEARQTWPVWTFLILVGLAIQGLVLWYTRAGGEPSGLAVVADVVTLIYVFLIAAAIFAGERENERGTLWRPGSWVISCEKPGRERRRAESPRVTISAVPTGAGSL